MLDLPTVILILATGFLHAAWHSLVKSGPDPIVVLTGMGLFSAATALVLTPFLMFPSRAALPLLAASVAFHLGYKFSLARSYTLADLGQAYPLGRGFVPLFAAGIAAVFLCQQPSLGQAIGIAMVSVGMIWLAGHSIRCGVDRRLFWAALGVGLTVACYTVLDAHGAHIAGDWAGYTAWLVIADATLFAAIISAIKGRTIWQECWHARDRVALSGVLGLISFAVLIWALSRSGVGAIAALRESSVVFATLIGILLHGERKSTQRLAASTLIAAGLIAVVALR